MWQSTMTSLSCFAVLLCVAISHLSTPVSSQDHYPPGWWDAPSSLDDFPVEQIGNKTMIIVNPWDYLQRMGIFKLMVQTTQGYFKSWGYNNTGNPSGGCHSSSDGKWLLVDSAIWLKPRDATPRATVCRQTVGGLIWITTSLSYHSSGL